MQVQYLTVAVVFASNKKVEVKAQVQYIVLFCLAVPLSESQFRLSTVVFVELLLLLTIII